VIPDRARCSDDQVASGAVAGFDLTFRAPKSVSILFGIADLAVSARSIPGTKFNETSLTVPHESPANRNFLDLQ
jgi:hypothetical protein